MGAWVSTRSLHRFPAKTVRAAYVFINGFFSIAVMGGLAWLTGVPFVFPSLGPTAVLLSSLQWLPRNGASQVGVVHELTRTHAFVERRSRTLDLQLLGASACQRRQKP